jgi:hypothetical protein
MAVYIGKRVYTTIEYNNSEQPNGIDISIVQRFYSSLLYKHKHVIGFLCYPLARASFHFKETPRVNPGLRL